MYVITVNVGCLDPVEFKIPLNHKCIPVTFQMHLALYCFANGQLSTALKLLYRARYLMLLVCGEDHPEMALLDVSTVFTLLSYKQLLM